MHKKFALVLILLAATSLVFACSQTTGKGSGKLVGGECAYHFIPGTATVTSLAPPGADENNCPKDPQKVTFNFTPHNPGAVANYRVPTWSDEGQTLTVSGGKNPPRAWVSKEGLKVGSTVACVRKEIISGTCTPVIFEFPGLDLLGAAEYCKR